MKLGSAFAASAVVLLLQACAPIPGEGPGGPIVTPPTPGGCAHTGYTGAFVDPTGATVEINHQPLRGRCPLAPGDLVVTGVGSTATISFDDGTVIALAERTDPRLGWSANEIKLGIDQGWAWVQTGTQRSVEWVSNLGSGLFYSKGAVNVQPGQVTAYLFEGHMRLQRPVVLELAPMYAVAIGADHIPRTRAITPQEAQRIAALTRQRLVIKTPPATPLSPQEQQRLQRLRQRTPAAPPVG